MLDHFYSLFLESHRIFQHGEFDICVRKLHNTANLNYAGWQQKRLNSSYRYKKIYLVFFYNLNLTSKLAFLQLNLDWLALLKRSFSIIQLRLVGSFENKLRFIGKDKKGWLFYNSAQTDWQTSRRSVLCHYGLFPVSFLWFIFQARWLMSISFESDWHAPRGLTIRHYNLFPVNFL